MRHLLALYLLTTSSLVFAADQTFPLPPRLTADGVASDYAVAGGDGMAALWGNSDQILFIDAQGKSGFHSSWLGSLGLGYRQTYNDARILGGYVFADRNVSNQNHTFWLVSPGLESMGRIWDFRVNGYFPVSSRRVEAAEGFAEDFGLYNYVTFAGHDQFDRLATLYQNVGEGADAEIARIIPGMQGLTAHIGGYYFNMDQASDIKGVEGRLEYPLDSHVSLSFGDSYDNVQHNLILTGIQFTFGGLNNSAKDRSEINQRILDPITRNLATQDLGNGTPIANEVAVGSQVELFRSNIWFFQPGPVDDSNITDNSCTFEHPCTGFSQQYIDSITDIAPGASFYFSPGSYPGIATGNPYGLLQLYDNESIYGRTANYNAPAQGVNRAIFNGGFQMGNNTLLDSIQLLNTSDNALNTGVLLFDVTNVTLNNVKIGDMAAPIAYGEGIFIANTNTNTVLNINNSEIDINSSSALTSDFQAAGIVAEDISGNDSLQINFNNSTINLNSDNMTGKRLEGISAVVNPYQSMTLNINNSNITVSGQNSSLTNASVAALDLGNVNNIVTIDHSNINATAQGINEIRADGIVNNSTGNNAVNVENSAITASVASTGNATATDINLATTSGNNTVNVTNSSLTATANSSAANATAYGIFAQTVTGINTITVDGLTTFNVNAVAPSGTATAQNVATVP